MNKQAYIAPAITLVSLRQQSHILAGSPGIMVSEDSADAGEEVLSRQFSSCWDDEE